MSRKGSLITGLIFVVLVALVAVPLKFKSGAQPLQSNVPSLPPGEGAWILKITTVDVRFVPSLRSSLHRGIQTGYPSTLANRSSPLKSCARSHRQYPQPHLPPGLPGATCTSPIPVSPRSAYLAAKPVAQSELTTLPGYVPQPTRRICPQTSPQCTGRLIRSETM